MAVKIKEISVFVDESGTFDSDAVASQFYIVCDGFGLIVKNHADEVKTGCFNVGVESPRLIYKHTDLIYLFAHIRK